MISLENIVIILASVAKEVIGAIVMERGTMEIRFVTTEELHRIAAIKSLYSIRMSEEVESQGDTYDIWMAKFRDREDLLLYVRRKR